MKKLFFFIILAAFIFISCGGHKPKTEPIKSTTSSNRIEETESQQPPDQIQNSIQEEQAAKEENKKEETAPSSGTAGKENKPGHMKGKPTAEEVIPIIEPKEKPPEITDAERLELNKTTDAITSGIITISRDFGYPGEIDVPDNFRKRVAHYIRYFSKDEKGTRFFLRTMTRGSQYLPMIRRIFKEKHLPSSLAYMPVIESGFNPNARSRAGALGMWQFMRGTARMYGLKITRSRDERKDPIKSTYAAAEYLNDLLAMFGMEDPFLGICAYNAGEGKILNALRKISYTERSFWTLVKKNLLKSETDEYIPQFLAVILIAKNPEKYAAASYTVSPEPGEAKTVEQEDQEIISTLHYSASKDNLGEESAKPPEKVEVIELKKEAPKPDSPAPKAKTVTTNKPQIYKVKRGDTLYSIARRYKVGVRNLKSWNNLRSNRIFPGQRLNIYASTARTGRASSRGYKLIYTVNYTDSLARIALFFKGITAREIMQWNRLRRTRIHPKQKLVLYLDEPPRKVVTHIIKRGENAFKIAQRYGLRVEYVLSLNGLVTNSRLKPGKKIKIYYF